MALVNINEGLKEEYSMNKTFSAEYDFSCVRQIALADRFTCVLTCACVIARVKTKRPEDGPPKLFLFCNKYIMHVLILQ